MKLEMKDMNYLAYQVKKYVKFYEEKYDIIINVSFNNTPAERGNETHYMKEMSPRKFFINISIPVIEKLSKTKEDQYNLFIGGFFHELSHCIYTNYQEFIKRVNPLPYKQEVEKEASGLVSAIKRGVIEYDKMTEQEKEAYLKVKKAFFKYVETSKMHGVVNSIEDASIENAIVQEEPDIYNAISKSREMFTYADLDAVKKSKGQIDEILNEGKDALRLVVFEVLESILAEIRAFACLGYRKKSISRLFSYLSYKNTKELKEYGLKRKDIKEFKQLALYGRFNAKDTKERISVSEVIIEKLSKIIEVKTNEFFEHYLKSLLKYVQENNELDSNSFSNGLMGGFPEFAVEVPTSSGCGMPAPTPPFSMGLPEELKKKIEDKSRGENDENGENVNKPQDNVTPEESDSKNAQDENEEYDIETLEKFIDEISNFEERMEKNNEENAKELQKKKIKLFESNKFKAEVRKSAQNMNRVKKFKKKVKVNSDDDIPDRHKGVPYDYCSTNTFSPLNKDVKNLEAIANTFANSLKKIFVWKKTGKVEFGKTSGKINTSALYREALDLKVFKSKQEGKINKVRFAVLIDESGSMSGEKIKNARQAAYILASACFKIGVPISVMGHTTSYSGVLLNHYVDYTTRNKTDVKKVLNASANGGNRDGYALFKSTANLVHYAKPDELLISIIISDGEPTDGYRGLDDAIEDIKGVYDNFEKHYKVKTIGIGIGEGTKSVKKIYKNQILIPNVKFLSENLLKILREVMLK